MLSVLFLNERSSCAHRSCILAILSELWPSHGASSAHLAFPKHCASQPYETNMLYRPDSCTPSTAIVKLASRRWTANAMASRRWHVQRISDRFA